MYTLDFFQNFIFHASTINALHLFIVTFLFYQSLDKEFNILIKEVLLTIKCWHLSLVHWSNVDMTERKQVSVVRTHPECTSYIWNWLQILRQSPILYQWCSHLYWHFLIVYCQSDMFTVTCCSDIDSFHTYKFTLWQMSYYLAFTATKLCHERCITWLECCKLSNSFVSVLDTWKLLSVKKSKYHHWM